MAQKNLNSITFHGLPDTYTIPAGGGGNAELQPLTFEQVNFNTAANTSLGQYDGTASKKITLPMGVTKYNGSYIENVTGVAVLDEEFRVSSRNSDKYTFDKAFAYGMHTAGTKYTYVTDTTANKQYLFAIDRGDTSQYTVQTAPLVGESGGGAIQPLTFTGAVEATYDGTMPEEIPIPTGGQCGVYRYSVTTTEEVSAITIPLPATFPTNFVIFNLNAFFRNNAQAFMTETALQGCRY